MEDRIIKILQSLKLIKPDEGFVSRSRNTVLNSPQNTRWVPNLNFLETLKFSAALTLASALLFVFLGGLAYFNVKNASPMLLSGVNDSDLKVEEANVDFQIQLGEVTYHLDSEKELGAQIEELIKNY